MLHDQDQRRDSAAPAPAAGDEAPRAAEHALRLARAAVDEAVGRSHETAVSERAMAAATAAQSIALPFLPEMEHHFGCSFAHVKAYVDPGKAEAMNARAFTYGTDITFATASPDRALVMHELTHVVQQTTGRQGSVAADEAEAEHTQSGAKPAAAGEARAATAPEVRKDKEKPIPGELLTEAQVKSAIAFNNSHWKGTQRTELLTKISGGPAGTEFAKTDILTLAKMQKAHGVPDTDVDGKAGPTTMAFLLREGLHFTLDKAKASEVRLLFYPGEFEDLAAWEKGRADLAKQGKEDEYRSYETKGFPPGHGTIYIEWKGNIVDAFAARGGPPFTMKDGKDHTADPSKKGQYTLGKGKSVVTGSWVNSQIAWDSEIRENEGDIQYKEPGSKDWKYATNDDPKHKLGIANAMPRKSFHEGGRDVTKPLVKKYVQNDFGETGFRVEGSPGLYIHTGPGSEDRLSKAQTEEELTCSHGCLHVQPAKRNDLMAQGFLQKGVTIVIKGYKEVLDPGSPNYGKAKL
jgi:hypothetical protein